MVVPLLSFSALWNGAGVRANRKGREYWIPFDTLQLEERHEEQRVELNNNTKKNKKDFLILLDLSSYESGTFTLRMEKMDLSELVLTAYERFEFIQKEKRVHVELKISDSIFVVADRLRLSQVLTNLMSNAFKHVEPTGKIHILATENNGQVLFKISNFIFVLLIFNNLAVLKVQISYPNPSFKAYLKVGVYGY